MSMKKISAEQLKQLEHIVNRDREAAFELGFSKFATEKGLTQTQYEELYAEGLAKLAELAEQPKA